MAQGRQNQAHQSRVRSRFAADKIEAELEGLITAIIRTCEAPAARMLRSAVAGSRSGLGGVQYDGGLRAIDWRDVIVAG